ncbi:MAG TPA: hypothetical protein VET65_05235 [Candidatus Limnocylindrales bacterium]|nr:hypothetical protein [Candidatus Limnocylindrales bacterium]
MTGALPARFYIRYGLQRWDDGKWFIGIYIALLIGLTAYSVMVHQFAVLNLALLVLAILFAGVLRTMSRLAYIEIGADHLRLRYLMTRVDLPFGSLTRVRKQPLGVAFQAAERRRYLNRFVRRLSRDPAVYIRIDRREADLIDDLERRLGARMVSGADLVLPITDTDAFIAAVKGRVRAGSG